jgi:hypothetical protein
VECTRRKKDKRVSDLSTQSYVHSIILEYVDGTVRTVQSIICWRLRVDVCAYKTYKKHEPSPSLARNMLSTLGGH